LLFVEGEVEEGAVDEDDRVVRLARIGHDHRHARHFDGGEEDVAAVFEAALVDVAGLPVALAGVAQRVEHRTLECAVRRHAHALAAALRVEVLAVVVFAV